MEFRVGPRHERIRSRLVTPDRAHTNWMCFRAGAWYEITAKGGAGVGKSLECGAKIFVAQ